MILVSINDREVHHLRCVLNELFGEENFYAQFIWNNEGNVDNQSAVKGVHEYVLCFARNKECLAKPGVVDPNVADDSKLFNERIENTLTKNGPKNPVSVVELPIGFPAAFDEGVLEPRDDKWPHILDEVQVSGGKLTRPCRLSSGWSSRSMLDLFIANGFVPIEDSEGKVTSFALTPSGAIYSYKDRSERQGHVLSILRNMGTTQQMSRQLEEWGIEFPYPKPSFLIQYLIDVFTEEDSADLIVDFFAGSGSTAHAVMQQNREDGGNRRYLLVQLPQAIEGTDDTVADLLHRRIVATAESLGGSQHAAEDRGFRSFRLGASNFRVWGGQVGENEELAEELSLFADGLTSAATTEGIVAELLLKAGFELTEPVSQSAADGIVVHTVADGQLVVAADGHLTVAAIEAMVAMRPALILILDRCFGDDDELKVNAVQDGPRCESGVRAQTSLSRWCDVSAVSLKFESDLAYQHRAVEAVVGLFAGMPLASGEFSVESTSGAQLALTELGIGNPDPGGSIENVFLENLKRVQEANDLPISPQLKGPHFTVEMETGTGKTYVYLRTVFELHKQYGFTKFVIVVPSVAIREGVLASINLMGDHFKALYSSPVDAQVYDSKNLGRVRQFATSHTMQILVMNIQAFQKDVEAQGAEGERNANVINRPREAMGWRKPIEFIQSCRPVVIVDEPQNMETTPRVQAIERLNPMCTLRYSATHTEEYNPIYRLGPVEAHELRLVKSIEVASVVEDENLNAAFVGVEQVDQPKMRARLRINVGSGSSGSQKSMWVKRGDDLQVLSDGRHEYETGYIVENISFRPGDEHVEFNSGRIVYAGEEQGGFADDVRRAQIRETVRQHLDRELALHRQGEQIKVLSLIFLDKVAKLPRVHR